jgi:hypothetical protein
MPVYQVERLVSFGRHQEALAVLDGYRGRLPADEAGFFRLQIYTRLGWTAPAETEADALLSLPMRPQLAAQFCAHLLRHPERPLLARYADRFVRYGPRPAPEAYPHYAATLLTAARCGDAERSDYLDQIIRQQITTDVRALGALREILAKSDASKRIELILPAVPLPTEVVYALLERPHHPPAP